ncbi:hypothetical protein GBK04_13440 [Cytophagaceae bacterium SJW1-29]|uniref:T9SS type A sorting domain-containing protein n=2 Tax=Salmonirosea aquatica TaxID=2654236 RepID=A0A7C9FRZ9_9BACT|nr:hypothetical protein [Cytophagaceae bacterium SJW1-29]
MYKYAILFCLVGFSAFAQAPTIVWDKTFGGDSNEFASSIVTTSDGYFILSGTSISNKSGEKSEDRRAINYGYDYWIIKIDQDGKKIWDKTIGGPGGAPKNSSLQMVATNDGGVIFAGDSDLNSLFDKSDNSKGEDDYWIFKLDKYGNKIWDKTFGGNSIEWAFSIVATTDGNFVVGGRSSSDKSGDKTQPLIGPIDYWLVKIDPNGNKIWDKTIGGSGVEYFTSMVSTSNGDLVISGTSNSDKSGDKTDDSKGSLDYWIVKLDIDGNKIWDKTIGGSDGETNPIVKVDPTGGFIVAGNSYSNKSGDKTENNRGASSYWIVKLDDSGKIIWDKTLGSYNHGGAQIFISSLISTLDGGFAITGSHNSGVFRDDSNSGSWIIKMSNSGQVEWEKSLNGGYNMSMIQTNNGNFATNGTSGTDYRVIILKNEVPTQTITLSTTLRFGGGLSTLNVDTGYNLTASLKNTSSTTWQGDIYLKANNGTPTLLQANQGIGAGSTLDLNGNFQPQAVQIGANVPIELLTKQGSGDFVRVATVNGTVNPVLVNIEAASTVPVVRVPFIRLNTSEVSPGGTVQVMGGNFEPGTSVTLGSTPQIEGATYPSQMVASDGSININFTVPVTYQDRYLTLVARDTKQNNPGASISVVQPKEVATLSIVSPDKENATIEIIPGGEVAIQIADKLLKGAAYAQSGASRKYRYEIGYRFTGGADPNAFTLLYQMSENSGLLNSELRETIRVPMPTAHFGTGTQGNGWPLQFIVRDMYDNQRIAESPKVYVKVVPSISKVSLKWDRSFTPMPATDPIGIAADGVARIYLVVEKTNSSIGSPIQSVNLTLLNSESGNDPANFNNGAWLGRVKYATQQNNNQYSEEANDLSTISAQKLTPNSDGKYWFWYVAPDDFMRDGLPAAADYSNESERYVDVKVTITYADGSVEQLIKSIQIVRPPLMLVHGLNSDSGAWDKFKLISGTDYKLFKGNIYKVNIQSNGPFDVNALGILDGTIIGRENSIGGVLEKTRAGGYVASQVDYVCHSMGGSVLRTAIDKFSSKYYGSNYFYKTYQKGSVNKVITINTPHGGSPWADLVDGIVPLLPYTFNKPLSYAYLAALEYQDKYSAYHFISNFIKPDAKSISKKCNIFIDPICYYSFEPSSAIKNLQVIGGNGGIDFKEFNLPTHIITSDFLPGQTPIPDFENTIIDIENLNSQVQFLYKIFSYFNEGSETSLPPPLDDVLYKFKELHPRIGVVEKYLTAPEKALYVLKLTEAFMLVATRYSNWWDGDIVVPLVSQQAKLSPNSPQISHFSDNNLLKAMLNYNHISVTDQLPISNKVKELLNKRVNSEFFGSLPSNTRPQAGGRQAAPETVSKSLMNNSTSKKVYREEFNRNKINITKPFSNEMLNAGMQFSIEVNLSDSTNLKSVIVNFQIQEIGDTLQKKKHLFSISSEKGISHQELILAKASYVKGDTTICYFDTLIVNIKNDERLLTFSVSPEVKSIANEVNFRPNYQLQYPTFITQILDPVKLNVSISNPACLTYNAQTGQFKGIQKGEAVVIFTYDGTFKDTMYVAVGGGGEPYPQQIQTANVPVIGNGTVCTGATILVPFTTSGGAFDEGNQFIVQLSDATGENFTSLETTGTSSPLSAKIPNGLADADTYKVRVVSLSPPVLGSVAAQTLKIRSCATQGTFTVTGPNVLCQGESVALTADGCAGTVSWSDGSTTTSITVSPTATTTYFATCTVGSEKTVASISPIVAPTITISSNEGTCFDGNVILTASGLPSGGSLLWKRDGTLIPSATTATYQATQPGTYTAEPQAEAWTWQNPLPDGEDFNDIHFVSDLVGIAVGNKGKIVRTTDGGDTWNVVSFAGKDDLKSVYFTSSTVGWVAGSFSSTIWKTTDAGLTWSDVNLGGLYPVNDLFFTDPNNGWLLSANGAVVRTNDGGLTWTPYTTGTGTGQRVHFTSYLVGWMVGYNGGLAKTTDGGVNWTQISSGIGTNSSWSDVFFVNPSIGWIAGYGGALYKTVDGGNTWNNMIGAFSTNTYFKAIFFSDVSHGTLLTSQGIFVTSDGGVNWSSTVSPPTYTAAIYMWDATKAWITGRAGRILKGSQGPTSYEWKTTLGQGTVAGEGDYGKSTLDFADKNIGWAGTTSNFLTKTVNGGKVWTKTTLFGVVALDFLDQNIGYAVAAGTNTPKAIYKSTDGGTSWIKQYDLGSSYFESKIHFIDSNTGWVSNQQSLYRTTDGGISWNSSNLPDLINSLFFTNASTGYAGTGFSGQLAKTTDGGVTWSIVGSLDSGPLYNIYFINNSTGWVSGNTAKKTTDGGATWNDFIVDGSPLGRSDLSFSDPLHGVMLVSNYGAEGHYYFKTQDGGSTWTRASIPTRIYPDRIKTTGPDNAWVMNNYGAIMYYSASASSCSSNAITLSSAPAAPTVSSANINSGQTAPLTATNCGGTVNWYSVASAGNIVGTGTSFTTPVLTTTTTYYASCTVNNCESTSRGSGTVTVNGTTSGEIFSIKTGSWHDPSTWDCNCVPNNTHIVEIKANHTVTVSAADANLKDLKSSNGNLNFQNQRKLCFGCN